MKNNFNKKIPVLITALLSVGGCTEYKLRQFDTITPAGPAFNQYLAQFYGDLAKKKARERLDQGGGLIFIEKASDAAEPKAVLPENPDKYRLHDEEKPIFEQARAQLLQVLDSGARDGNPEVAASAQVNYDCWLFQQSLEMDDEFLQSCKMTYDQAMQVLTGGLMGAPAAPEAGQEGPQQGAQPMMDPAAQQEMMMQQQAAAQQEMMTQQQAEQPSPSGEGGATYDHAFFPLNSARITPQGAQALDAIAAEIQQLDAQRGAPVTLTVVGHTDATGPESRNIDLSLRRAYAARGYLHQRGITADRVNIDGRGSSEPLVPNKTGLPEPQNRRIDVYIHG